MRVFLTIPLSKGCALSDGNRYDLMSDMAFGGGSELMAAGRDDENVWKVLDEAML